MWIYRLGLTRAKYHALTGRPMSGREAADAGLVNIAVPFTDLETTVSAQAEELASLPMGQLAAQKLMVNQAYENMGLASTQTLGAILDGIMRNIPEAHVFMEHAAAHGVSSAVADRDGRFGDYSQAPSDRKPDPDNIIEP
jgi:enoyl-CoA hydratase